MKEEIVDITKKLESFCKANDGLFHQPGAYNVCQIDDTEVEIAGARLQIKRGPPTTTFEPGKRIIVTMAPEESKTFDRDTVIAFKSKNMYVEITGKNAPEKSQRGKLLIKEEY